MAKYNHFSFSWASFTKAVLLVLGLTIVSCSAVTHYLDEQRAKSGLLTQSDYCKENIRTLGELLRQYEQVHGVPPDSLSDLVPLETNRTCVFSCDLADCEKFEKIKFGGAVSSNCATSPVITYLYFSSAPEGVRIMCPVWHPELKAVDKNGSTRVVDRTTWERIKLRIEDDRL
jgi:hypothetical protein